MGGRLDWAAVPLLAELLAVDDAEAWLHGLIALSRSSG